MAVGMGIHGEPGIDLQPLATADEIGKMFVSALLNELPERHCGRTRCARSGDLNGLGAVKHEELFIIYGMVERELEAAGVVVVEPEVGEYATSFEMASAYAYAAVARRRARTDLVGADVHARVPQGCRRGRGSGRRRERR